MDTGFLLWKTGALHGMIIHMKKHFLFGLSILTALTVMDVPASDTDPADSAVSAEDLFSSDLPAGSGPSSCEAPLHRWSLSSSLHNVRLYNAALFRHLRTG